MWIERPWRDLRSAVRALVAGRLFSLAAVVCLSLGIATNTTMFSVFDAMFLRPLPFKDPQQLVSIGGADPATKRRVNLGIEDIRDLAPGLQAFAAFAGYSGRTATITDGGEPERISTQIISANLFSLLGETPQRGQAFGPDADRLSAMISDSLWHRRYAADPSVIGRVIHLDGEPFTIVGIMPPRFQFPSHSELWMPIPPAVAATATASPPRMTWIGRLNPGATLDGANAELGSRVLPATRGRPARTAVARLFGTTVVGTEERTITGALMGATTVLVLLACANVANLLLARGARRRREIAVRAALGASRGRIIEQLLVEPVVLALAATVIALPLAWYGIHWVHDAVPPTEPLGPYYVDWSLDLRTLAYAVVLALVTGLVFGLAPAFSASGRRLLNPLREATGASSGRATRAIHQGLIVGQMALALLLLAGASIFVRTYAGQRSVELGYDTAHLMTMRVYLAGPAYQTTEARVRFVDALAGKLRSLPGAHASTVTDLVPLDDQGGRDTQIAIEGQSYAEGKEPTIQYAGVAGAWAETFNVQVEGRTFSEQELMGPAGVALVNRTFAKSFWPGENPIGRRFRSVEMDNSPWITVIGVVPDIRTLKLDESGVNPPTAYVPHRFISTFNWGVVVRTQGGPATVTPAVAAAVHAVDPSVALFDVYPMEQVRWLSYWMYVMWGTMFGVFGLIALLIAAVGVYGVVYYTAAQRTKEIGLRVALGAGRAQVVWPMLRQVGLLSLLGIGIGLVGAWQINPVVANLLLNVSPTDPLSFAAVSALLAAIAFVATLIPAWRASAVNPLEALRAE
ncbi:MAG TPA: ABC transporter permease [Vicinamibacterales bacterium]|nr:ABC transporter permease [Vicinamibacterales bacterium]